ncbi:MAG TPA: hypothetical protein VGH83_01135 [Candidatus Acidoferrum sp.]
MADDQLHRENWGTKVYHGILNALGGTNDVSFSRDPLTGKMTASTVKRSTGDQWKQIISGAFTGYAAGAGRTGPGSTAAKFGMGIQAGQQQAKEGRQEKINEANQDFDAQHKVALTNATLAMQGVQLAKATYDLGRDKVAAAYTDSERESNFEKVLAAGGEGTQDLGILPDFQAAMAAFQKDAKLHDHQVNGRLVQSPHVNASGKIDGVHAAIVTPNFMDALIPDELAITEHAWKDGKVVDKIRVIPKNSLTGRDFFNMSMAQSKLSMEEAAKKQEAEARTKEADTAASIAPATIAEKNASAAESNAKAGQLNALSGEGSTGTPLVDAIGRGQVVAERMAYLLTKNPELMSAVLQKYPDFDGSKVGSYAQAWKEFTSTKQNSAGAALNSGATVLSHLRNLSRLNTTKSHIPHTNDWIAYHNQLETLVPELGKFYGNDTIPGLAGYRETLGSTLVGNRQAAIETQAHSMGQKFDSYVQQWRNSAPSKAYEAKMPGISPDAIDALKTLDPHYPQSTLRELEGLRAVQAQDEARGQGGGGAAGPQVVPQGATPGRDAQGKIVGYQLNGQWHQF